MRIGPYCETHYQSMIKYAKEKHVVIVKELTRAQCEKYRVMV